MDPNKRSFVYDQEKAMVPHSSTLAWKIHGQRSLVGCSPWGRWGSETTERLHFHFSLSCIGEGNGNPLQCSCLENPRDGGAWWAAVYGVAQSWTRLKRLSSSKRDLKHNSTLHFSYSTMGLHLESAILNVAKLKARRCSLRPLSNNETLGNDKGAS